MGDRCFIEGITSWRESPPAHAKNQRTATPGVYKGAMHAHAPFTANALAAANLTGFPNSWAVTVPLRCRQGLP